MRKTLLIIGFVFFVLTQLVICQIKNRGQIEGIVTSSEDNKPLVGANIIVQNTVFGTTTDINGKFLIKNLPFGKYKIKISMVGYDSKIIEVELYSENPVIVKLELEPSVIQTAQVVITANKREQSLQEVPISVSVINNDELYRRNITTLDNALRYVPGVNVTRSQINIRGSTGFSYGVGSRVLMLIDGLPFLSGDTEEIIWESIPVGNIERIEVVKGAGSALYGSSALGGVINIITKTPSDEPETRLRAYGGLYDLSSYQSWNEWAVNTRTMSGISLNHQRRVGAFSVVTGFSRTLDDGYRQNDYWKRWNVWSRFGYDLSPFQTINISFNLLSQRRGNFLWWKDFEHAFVPPEENLLQHVQSLRWNLNGSYKQFVSKEFFYTLKLSWYETQWEDNIKSGDLPGTNSHSDIFTSEFQSFYQLSDENILTAGLTGSTNIVRAQTIFGDHSSIAGAFYAQDELSISDKFRFSFGGRYDVQKLKGAQTVSQFNPKFGISYNPNPLLIFRSSLGRAFRAPSVAEIFTKTSTGGISINPNPELRPERSWSYEIGSTLMLTGFFNLDLSLFKNEFWDLIEPTFVDNVIQFRNITRAKISGAEITLILNGFSRKLVNQFSYTYVYPRDASKNDILKYRSRHLFYISSEFIVEPLRVNIDFRYQSRFERIDDEFARIVPDGDKRVAIYLVDLHTSFDWSCVKLPLVTSFHINNIFQYYYVELMGNMGSVRNYVLTLETKI